MLPVDASVLGILTFYFLCSDTSNHTFLYPLPLLSSEKAKIMQCIIDEVKLSRTIYFTNIGCIKWQLPETKWDKEFNLKLLSVKNAYL